MKIETFLFVEEEEKDFYEDDPEAEPLPRPNPNAPKGDAIYEQDLVTLRVTLTHENVPPPVAKGKGKTPKEPLIPPVHAPYFPKTIREGWWLLLTDKSTPEGGANPTNKPYPTLPYPTLIPSPLSLTLILMVVVAYG